MKSVTCLLVLSSLVVLPRIARAEDAAPAAPVASAAPAAPAAPAVPAVLVELSADDGRATLERRTATTGPSGAGLFDTGFFSVGHWEHACIAPCQARLDPRFAYRVAGDGLVPTESFALPHGGDVRVDAKMGGTSGRVAGAAFGLSGLALVAVGGFALAASPVLASEDVGSKGFRTGVLAGGVGATTVGLVSMGVGLALWLSNGSSARTEVARR